MDPRLRAALKNQPRNRLMAGPGPYEARQSDRSALAQNMAAPVDPLLSAYDEYWRGLTGQGEGSGWFGMNTVPQELNRLGAIQRETPDEFAAALFDSPLAPGFGAMATVDDVARGVGKIAGMAGDAGDDVALRLSRMRLGEQTTYAEDMLRRVGADVKVEYSNNMSQRFGPSQSRYVKGTLPDGRRVEVRISDHADVTGRDGDALNLGIAPSIVGALREAGIDVPEELMSHARAQYALRQTLKAEEAAARVAQRQAAVESLIEPIMGLGATREEAVEILTTAGKNRYRTILEAIGARTGKNPFGHVAARITKLKQDAGL